MSDERARQNWFAVALSSRVRAVPQRVLLFGSPVALVRTVEGEVLALEDRCPHRGAPLSQGKLGARGIVCPYHGWTFGSAGRCAAMPGAAGAQPVSEVRVPSFAVQERDGLVWVAPSATRPLPERILAMDPARRRFLWQTKWGAPVLEAQENFLDALHTHFIHPGLVRRNAGRATVRVTLRSQGDGFHVDYQGQQRQSGVLFRLFESQRTLERAYFSGLSVAQIEYRYASGWAMWITLCFAPETAESTHVFATLHVERRWAPRWLVRALVWPFLYQVARQDRRMLELQSHTRRYFPHRQHVVTRMDVVRPYLEAAWNGGSPDLPPVQDVTLEL